MVGTKLIVAAAAIAGIGFLAMTNLAAAQNYGTPDCAVATAPSLPWRWYDTHYPNYFEADWGPFFRHHVYRYGPIVACSAAATPPVISSKY
jgi:hypothetical protein